MPGILTPPSTGDAPAPQAQARPQPAPPPAQPVNTLSMNSPLAGTTPGPTAAPPMHANEAINAALMQAFRPIVPDAVNGLFGSALGQMMSNPITYYQPRPAPQINTRRSS